VTYGNCTFLLYRHFLIDRQRGHAPVLSPGHAAADLGRGHTVAQEDRFAEHRSADWFVDQRNGRTPRSRLAEERRLIRAGFRKESAVKIFYGAKLLVPLTFCFLAVVSGLTSYSPFFAYAASLGVGYLVPDFWLGRQIAKRQKEIRLGLPDALDFLVICIEAGLSLDQATARTAEELRLGRPALSDELDIVVLEQRAGRLRSDAWRQFAERSDVDTVRVLVSVLVQSEQLGTSVARTLRVHSDTLRTQRRQQVEEKAAKTSIKLVFPLVFFIFPSLFLVTLGPAAIIMAESFATFFSH
jgi:tight adherence protein C